MIRTFAKQLLSMTLSLLLVIATTPLGVVAQESGSTGYSGQGVPLTADELQALVAPIALYPDSLVAQILGAATFPDQIAAAASWLQQNSNLTGTTLMKTVDTQPWDPSVKALTQFPSVLGNLATNLSWTSSLGEAYHTQAADVMTAVQVLRAKALAAGNLKSGSQIRFRTTVAASHRDSICESAGRIRPCVQSRGSLRLSLCCSGIRSAAGGGNRSACVWSRNCSGRDDERWMLRLGI